MRILVLAVAIALLTAGCGSDSQEPGANSESSPSLVGTSWVLTEVVGTDGLQPAVDTSASINFEAGGTLSGSTGCNRFTGRWSQDGEDLSLDPGATTLMACDDPLGAQETAVITALSETATFTTETDDLTLRNAAGDVLATYAAAVSDLSGTSWQATGVNNGAQAVVSNETTSDLTLTFGADGTVTGFAGCTEFGGQFSMDGSSISLTNLAATQPCTDSVALIGAQDQYLAALAAATTYRIDGNTLELRDNDGALQVGFTSSN